MAEIGDNYQIASIEYALIHIYTRQVSSLTRTMYTTGPELLFVQE